MSLSLKFVRTIILLIVSHTIVVAQTTVTFQPHGLSGIDIAYGNNAVYLSPDSNTSDLGCIQWTCGGTPCELASILKFDLSSIPANATITDARLSLYANTQQSNGNIALGPMYGTNNSVTLYPITSSWNMNSVSWSNMPLYSAVNSTTLSQSTSNYQDYLNLNVTGSVSQMIMNPSNNFGWIMRINTNSFYNSMIFCSSNFPDSTKHPKLEVTYVINNCVLFQPDPSACKDISYGNIPAYLSPDSNSTDLGADQWTCGGAPCELRSLLHFDLSALPTNSIIQYAKLSLFSNPQQSNGNVALGPMYGTSNACELLKITSPWQLANITWNNQPSYTSTDVVLLNQSLTNNQDYLNIDVTNLVQDWINQPASNFGWMMKMVSQTYYNSMIFCSSDFADPAKRPILEICLNPVGLSEVDQDRNIQIYPNPFTDEITIYSTEFNLGTSQIYFTDLLGKSISTPPISGTKSSDKISFQTTHLPKGVYFIKVVTAGKIYSFKRLKL